MNKLAILPLLALVFTLGLANTAYAESVNIFDNGGHDFTTDENISENPAIAPRAVSPLHSYGYGETKPNTGHNDIVCGDHLCANGEQPPVLSKYRFYGLMGN